MLTLNKNHAEQQDMLDKNLIVGLVVLGLLALAVYSFAPRIRKLWRGERFTNPPGPIKAPAANGSQGGSAMATAGAAALAAPHAVSSSSGVAPAGLAAPAPGGKSAEGFADFNSIGSSMGPVPMGAAGKPQGCYPREQLNPSELLPMDVNSQWAAVNPTGSGDIQGKNFLSAGALVGIDSIGQSLRNANRQLRSEPPCPQVVVSPFMQPTIEPDLQRRPLE